MAKLLYQGHGSFRITADDGRVIYIDPYAGEGYDLPADIILVSHQHGDHNQIGLVTQKPNCRIITEKESLAGGTHNTFDLGGIDIVAVEAGGNKGHDVTNSVGYIITLENVTVYASGDTSYVPGMEKLAAQGVDYALLCCDGIYNMDVIEAARCAKLIGAKHNIPIHMKPKALFDRKIAESFDAPNRIILEAGETLDL